eukprot:scaffold13579_cov150-Alexandrium_tamarense.AAC.1
MLVVGVAMVKEHVFVPLERSLAKKVATTLEHVIEIVVLRLKINRAMGYEHAVSLPELSSRKAVVTCPRKHAPSGMVSVQLKTTADVMGTKIGKGSCQGRTACYAWYRIDEDYPEGYRYSDGDGATIGDGSCNNVFACNNFRGIVGNDSCNSRYGCGRGQGIVHDGSCGRSDSGHEWACWDMRSESRERQETSDIILYFLTILSSFTHLLRHCA